MALTPGIDITEHQGRLTLHCRAGVARETVVADTLLALMEQAGYGGWFTDPAVMAAAAARCNSDSAAFELELATRLDARIDIDIDPDGMNAWGVVTPAYGGAPLDVDSLVQTLTGKGIVFGLDESTLVGICEASQAGRFLVAQGQAAVNGDDVRFELLVNLTRDRSPKVGEDGLIDFRELGEIPFVDAGQPLMRRIPPTVGKPGRTLLAGMLYPKSGRDEPFAPDLPGTALDPNDSNLLIAAVKGQPVKVGENGVMVEQVIHFDGASMASGNIVFDGTVQIDGDVQQGMKVQAKGDIIVSGTVDGGILSAGGSVFVHGGVIAHSDVIAAGDVSARFVENSQIHAGATIGVDDMALQSQLHAGNQILIGRNAPKRGRLVGGSAKAMMLISAPIVGDAASSVTQLMVGVNPRLETAFQGVQELIATRRHEVDDLHKLIAHLKKQSAQATLLARAEATLAHTQHTLAILAQRHTALLKQLALFDKARVDVGVGVQGAVDLAFGQTVRALRRTFGSGSFSVEGHLVLFTPHEGDSSEI